VQKDPNYVLAQLGIGMVWAARSNILDLPSHEGWAKAKSVALTVLALDDTLAEAHNLLGTVLFQYERDWPAATREFRRAIELNPNFADAHRFYSLLLAATGRRNEGMTEIKRALDLDPHSPVFQVNYGIALFYLGHDDDAIEIWQKLVRTDAEFRLTHGWLRDAFYKKGMYAEAIAEARKSTSTELSEVLTRGYAEGGYQRAMHMAAEVLAARFDHRYVHPTLIAKLYVHAGEKDRALDWLERAYAERDSQLIFLPLAGWDSLRAEPRLQALLRRMNLPG
jgi:tetratricopeptide (TPR) repeat protein